MKEPKPHIGVIVVAAGSGKRMQAEKNKVLLPLGGTPILTHTLQVFFHTFPECECILAIKPEDEIVIQELLAQNKGLSRVRYVFGGKERQESVYNALNALSEAVSVVLIHDAARPLVSPETLRACFEKTCSEGAACIGVPVKDTIKQVESGMIQKTLDRSMLWSAQTPQGFRKNIIMTAHQKAAEEGFLGTDDAMLIERLGIPVIMVQGNPENIKITTAEDLAVAEMLIKKSQ